MEDEITAEMALTDLAKLYKWLYFYAMIHDRDLTTAKFIKIQKNFLNAVVDKLHDRYEDHIEGIKKQIIYK